MSDNKGKIAAVGTFDGVHIGHRALLRAMCYAAARRDLRPLAVTFSTHPLARVRPESVPGMLCTLDERLERIKAIGADVVTLDFDDALMHLTANEFMTMLMRDYGVRALMLGHNNTFGSDCLHGIEAYRAAAPAGMEIIPCRPVLLPDGREVSSSAVRRAIADADLRLSCQLLGRPFALQGVVECGQQIGRTIGFPTANIAVAKDMLMPVAGVYAARARVGNVSHPAVVNIGTRPTVDHTEHPRLSVEAHLIDFEGDLYGTTMRLELISRLRDERTFESLDALKEQIAKDRDETVRLFTPVV